MDVGFYDMANAAGLLLGTLLSGVIFQLGGLRLCLAPEPVLQAYRPMTFAITLRACVCALSTFWASASSVAADDVTVFAASSLKESLEEIAKSFEAETGHNVVLSFAGSSALARQIEFGAPADIFLSASADWMDFLDARDLIDPTSRSDILSNRLVLVSSAGEVPLDIADKDAVTARLGKGRLAMALVEAVPAGIYGKAALDALGLWERVAPQVAQADSARAALALVALGAAPLGIVYRTDALAEPDVTILATFPSETHDEIRYPAALVAASGSAAAPLLLDYLRSPAADKVFEQDGFILMED